MANPAETEGAAESPYAQVQRIHAEEAALSSTARQLEKAGLDTSGVVALLERKEEEWRAIKGPFDTATREALHAALAGKGLGSGAVQGAKEELWKQSEGRLERATPELMSAIAKQIADA